MLKVPLLEREPERSSEEGEVSVRGLTVLKLHLHLQVLSEQVHHHRLHVPPNGAAVPEGQNNRVIDRHWEGEGVISCIAI